MSRVNWWGNLDRDAQLWILDHLGEVLPEDVAAQVCAAGGRLRRTTFLSSERIAYELRRRDAVGILQVSRAAA